MQTQHQKISASLLYRLMDEDHSDTYYLNDYYADIRSHLELLLNTRHSGKTIPEPYAALMQSPVNTGIPNFNEAFYGNKKNQQKLCNSIKKTIETFEPRIQKINVNLLNEELPLDRTLRIRIEGEIPLKPKPVDAVFESEMSLEEKRFRFDY